MELLAPANTKTFFQSINNGADAVYFGLNEFSARASADNITLENLDYYVSYAHLFGIKMYCAVNTLIKNAEINSFISLIVSAYNKGVDAFILQDIFLGKYIKEIYPQIELHLSTQAGVNNIYGAKLAKEFGFSRVILSRETAKEEIKEIASFIETEIFVHGALCSSFSGHCYYSSYIGGNSGNRGRCKQPCRQPFYYQDNTKIPFNTYNLSLSDLMLCDYIQEIKDLGVKSLKIEGRMRSEEYTACAVSLYKKAIEGKPYLKEKEDLKSIYNRGDYTSGYFVKDNNIISDKIQSHKGDYFAKITKISKNNLICNKIALEGDCFKILRDGQEVGNCLFSSNKFVFKGDIKVGDCLYITKSTNIINKYINNNKQKEISLDIKIDNTKIVVKYLNEIYISEDIVQKSINKPTEFNEIILNFNKVDNYPFKVKINLEYNNNCFIPKSLLNAFRRSVFRNIFKSYQNIKNIKKLDNITDFNINYENKNISIVLIEDLNNTISADKYVICPNDYNKLKDLINSNQFNKFDSIYLYIPAFLNNKDFALIEPYLNRFKGVYADGLCGIYIAKLFNLPLILGLGLNIFNSISYNIAKNMYNNCDIVVSKEISNKEYFGGIRQTFGKISLMEFIYCPFRNNCSVCTKKHYFNCKDKYENFVLRRVLLSTCRFELLTDSVVINNNSNSLINLIGLSEEQIKDFSLNNLSKFKKIIQKEVI